MRGAMEDWFGAEFKCPLCRHHAPGVALPVSPGIQIDGTNYGYDCPLCGQYQLTHELRTRLETLIPDLPRETSRVERQIDGLVAHIRASNKIGETPLLSPGNWEALADGHLHTSVATKLQRVLEHLAELSQPGERVYLNKERDYPLFDADDAMEVDYLVDALCKRVLVGRDDDALWITAEGWEHFEACRGDGGGTMADESLVSELRMLINRGQNLLGLIEISLKPNQPARFGSREVVSWLNEARQILKRIASPIATKLKRLKPFTGMYSRNVALGYSDLVRDRISVLQEALDSFQQFDPSGLSEFTVMLRNAVFKTGDATLDELLGDSRERFARRTLKTRKEAVEKIWDAFERLKTIEPGKDKKATTAALLERAIDDDATRARIAREMVELTEIGNTYMIRHSEVGKTPITRIELADFLFYRMFNLVRFLLRATGRGG